MKYQKSNLIPLTESILKFAHSALWCSKSRDYGRNDFKNGFSDFKKSRIVLKHVGTCIFIFQPLRDAQRMKVMEETTSKI